MPKIELNIPHNLTQSEALTRIQNFLPELMAQYPDKIKDLEKSWNDFSGVFRFKISGFKVSLSIDIEESAVVIKGDIPFAALLFKGQIEETIRAKAMELLRVK